MMVEQKSLIRRIYAVLTNPLTYFFYGCFCGVMGIVFWVTELLTKYLNSINVTPLLGIFITGGCLGLGYLWGYGNLDAFREKILRSKLSHE